MAAYYGIRGVAHQCQIVRDALRANAEFASHARCISDGITLAIDLHNAIIPHALSKILIRRPNAHFLHSRIFGGDQCRRGKRIVGFELDQHWCVRE